jgi:aminoglycoside phosphotransferase (APT) family kinase protein
MFEKIVLDVLTAAYGWKDPEIKPVQSGLINTTLRVITGEKVYLLQKVNTHVFKWPGLIDENLRLIDRYLQQHAPGYLFTAPVLSREGKGLVEVDGAFYRVFEWVEGSHTIDTVAAPAQAREAAAQFGKFTALLDGFDAEKLQITLPDFHNLGLRVAQFEQSIDNGNSERIRESADIIAYLRSQSGILERFETFARNPETRQRVTHHDTKISNILFDKEDKGLCVIDLDTVMPGYFLSDLGDMYRTYVCPVSEEEKDLDMLTVRKPFMDAIRNGYLSAMDTTLSNFEKDHFELGGQVLIYMQAIRFLADYLNNDVYYGSRYPGHNLVRAANQARLLAVFNETLG